MTTSCIKTPTAEQRHEMIALAAYYLAECRHFAPGSADADWLNAERMIDALIAAQLIGATTTPERVRNALKFSAA
ncbi:DUF2934 domain-containing protein [Chromatium okenii]|uniref:DUF2934 domain-containing protein n=1 Tax=Chromatium okenii TaxID=61644 RepID=UPI0026F34E5E|nr:DUF2934 domain-containing protein [Chromatium okenii]MBV5308299.1 DUF2934 domain-containing protein [Chromatium okenii]